MAEREIGAAKHGVEQRAGYGSGLAVLGVVLLAVLVVVGDHPVEDLVVGLIVAPVFGLLMALVSRKEAPVHRPSGTDRRRGFVLGLLKAGLVAVLLGVFVVLYAWAFGSDQGWGVVPGIMLGTGVWVALDIWRPGRRRGPPSPMT